MELETCWCSVEKWGQCCQRSTKNLILVHLGGRRVGVLSEVLGEKWKEMGGDGKENWVKMGGNGGNCSWIASQACGIIF